MVEFDGGEFERSVSKQCNLPPDGNFEFKMEDPAWYDISITWSTEDGHELRVDDHVRMDGGETPWSCQLSGGRLEILGPPPNKESPIEWQYFWDGPRSLSVEARFDLDPDGRAVFPAVPAGRGTVVGRMNYADSSGWREVYHSKVDVPAGGTVTVELGRK
jgi:hypothetical protein